MSIFLPGEAQCAMCGENIELVSMATANSMGAPDLDFRPAPGFRYTMRLWIQECPECGYVCIRLNEGVPLRREWFQRAEYVDCLGLKFRTSLARLFFRRYMICHKIGDEDGAMSAALNAAWVCDDRGERKNARICRKLALVEADAILKNEPGNISVQLKRIDMLRRAGCFDEALEACLNFCADDSFAERLVAFQKARILAKNTACFTMEDFSPEGWCEYC